MGFNSAFKGLAGNIHEIFLKEAEPVHSAM